MNDLIQKLPPQDVDAEQAILAAILLQNQAINKVVDALQKDDFYKEAHRKIYQAMLDLYQKNEPIDLITLSNHLRSLPWLEHTGSLLEAIGGATYLAQIMNAVPTAANIGHHAKIVHEKAVLRTLIGVSTDIVTECYERPDDVEKLLDRAEQGIFEISERSMKSAFVPAKALVKTAFEIIEKLADKKMTGLPSGFNKLDELTAGLQASDLIIIAGRPSMGKTAFALSLAQHVALREHGTVGIFSLEMSKEQLMLRMLCSEARVDASRIRTGHLGHAGNDHWTSLIHAGGRLSEASIFIDDASSISVLEMRAKARRLKAEHQLSLLIVDYLQLIHGRGDANSREQEISEISRSLKGLAKDLRIPVIALSQLNRAVETREKRRPMLADLRESGAIEQDADVVMFIYRQEVYEPCKCPREGNCVCGRRGITEIIIGKQRNGPIGIAKLYYNARFTRFEKLDESHPAYLIDS